MDNVIYEFFVQKSDLSFGRVHININLRGIDIEKKEEDRVLVLRENPLICPVNCMG